MSDANAPQEQKYRLPTDGVIYNIEGTYEMYIMFDVGGVKIVYTIDATDARYDWSGRPVTTISRDEWTPINAVPGGSAAELSTVTDTFGTYKSFWDSILGQVMGYNNPARNDPEVMRVIAEFAARPDMSEAELQNRLQRTGWFQRHTGSQLAWNSASEAEKQKLREQAVATIVESWWQFGGVRPGDDDPRVRNYVEDVASGKMSIGALNHLVRTLALEDSESPAAREARAEEEARRDRPITIENTAQNIRDQLTRWGLSWTNAEVLRWATDLVEKKKSDADLIGTFKQQAAVLYPWKDPDTETVTAAMPWLSVYERVMEQRPGLMDPKIQKALTAGQPVWEFEQDLKRSDEWMTTRNGQTEMYGIISDVGRRMGYV
jgi:hypothetical protein